MTKIGRPRKLTPEQVEEMRHLWFTRQMTHAQLALKYGVHRTTIGKNIVRSE
jgi:predicted DNA-binding protein (UPF0251 family)